MNVLEVSSSFGLWLYLLNQAPAEETGKAQDITRDSNELASYLWWCKSVGCRIGSYSLHNSHTNATLNKCHKSQC